MIPPFFRIGGNRMDKAHRQRRQRAGWDHAAASLGALALFLLVGHSGVAHGEAPPVDPQQIVLCRIGDECRLTTLERCLAKGGQVDPPWEACAPVLEVVPPPARSPGIDCYFPAEVAIRGRNRLVYRVGPYERTFGPGTYLMADFDEGRFRIADTLLVVPPPETELRAEDLRRLGGFFGVERALRAGVLNGSVHAANESDDSVRILSRKEACAWLHILRLLRRSATPLEVHLTDGHLTLMMVPLDEDKTAPRE